MKVPSWEFESPLRHHKKVNGLAEQSAGPFCFFRHRLLRLCTLEKLMEEPMPDNKRTVGALRAFRRVAMFFMYVRIVLAIVGPQLEAFLGMR